MINVTPVWREWKEAVNTKIKEKKMDKPKTIYIDDNVLRHEYGKDSLSLADMKKIVGGWIEYAHDDGETQIICNEEGKLFGLPYNEEATKLWYIKHHEKYGTPIHDVLVGDVLVLTGKARSI